MLTISQCLAASFSPDLNLPIIPYRRPQLLIQLHWMPTSYFHSCLLFWSNKITEVKNTFKQNSRPKSSSMSPYAWGPGPILLRNYLLQTNPSNTIHKDRANRKLETRKWGVWDQVEQLVRDKRSRYIFCDEVQSLSCSHCLLEAPWQQIQL